MTKSASRNKRLTKMSTLSSDLISDKDKMELAASCMQAREGAHCPYSKFRVGAAVLVRFSKTGEKMIFTGDG